MRSQTVRLGIFISTLVITAIIAFQLIWLKKVYNFEQRAFDQRITRSIRGYYEDVHRATDSFLILNKQIIRVNKELYFFKIEKTIHPDSSVYFIKNELEEEDVFTDYYVGFYDSGKRKYTYTTFIPRDPTERPRMLDIPPVHAPYNGIVLYFPYRTKYILALMNFWLISSVLLLVVLVLFGGSIYYFYRQKFLNETQKDFVNNFTHEFKTPVSVINLAAEVLENPEIVHKPERLAKYAAIVRYQGKYLQQQIERLLRYAHSESNHLQLHKEKVALHLLVGEALNNLQPLAEEKKAVIECDFLEEDDELLADHGYLLIVVTNLIENALKYAREPRIIITIQKENGEVSLSVKDNGKGIEKKYQDKIFNKFYRVTTGDQISARGFGLGLSFVKRIVLAHRGKIHVESIPGIGSNFIMKLPVS